MSETTSTPAAAPTPSLEPNSRPAPEPLYTPPQIGVATALATPIAGALLAAANLRAMGRGSRFLIVALGAACTAGILGVDVWGAGPFTFLALPVFGVVAWLIAAGVFGAPLALAGPRPVRGVVAIVVAVWLGLGVVGGGVVGALRLRAPTPDEAIGDNVAHSARELVNFRDGARREDAEEIARALVAAGAFTGTGTLRVDVDRPSSTDGALRITIRVAAEATDAELDSGRLMIKAVAAHLGRCVQARLLTGDGMQRAGGRLCP